MKIFILALVAVSVGLSECKTVGQTNGASPDIDDPRVRSSGAPDKGYSNGQALEKYFNIKTKDLEACNNAENLDANDKVSGALIGLTKANDARTPRESGDFQQVITNIVKAALPCADDKKVTKHVTYYNDKGCKKD